MLPTLPQFFDREADFAVYERRLPHWSQKGTMCFITWRTWDSMPRKVLGGWMEQRAAWLQRHGITPDACGLRTAIRRLSKDEQRDFRQYVSQRWEECLDQCHGACVLRNPELAAIVAASLECFDGQKYLLSDYVIMPNHVHLLASFETEDQMLAQCDSWKHYTAMRLNRMLGRRGRFWQSDGFDHLVRNADEFDRLRAYISDNPQAARLKPGEFRHWSRDWSGRHEDMEGGPVNSRSELTT